MYLGTPLFGAQPSCHRGVVSGRLRVSRTREVDAAACFDSELVHALATQTATVPSSDRGRNAVTTSSRKRPHGPQQQFDGAFIRRTPRDDVTQEGARQNDAEEQVEDVVGVDGWIDDFRGSSLQDFLELRASRNALIQVGRTSATIRLMVREKSCHGGS